MSRIGKLPIAIPAGVEIQKDNNTLTVKGPKGQLVRTFHKDMQINIEETEIAVTRPTNNKIHRSLHGLTRTLISKWLRVLQRDLKKL
jgi:large subunit ribosomal protein L6